MSNTFSTAVERQFLMVSHLCRMPQQGDPDKYQMLEGVRLKAESELRELATPDEW